jgi:hypothetical protein
MVGGLGKRIVEDCLLTCKNKFADNIQVDTVEVLDSCGPYRLGEWIDWALVLANYWTGLLTKQLLHSNILHDLGHELEQGIMEATTMNLGCILLFTTRSNATACLGLHCWIWAMPLRKTLARTVVCSPIILLSDHPRATYTPMMCGRLYQWILINICSDTLMVGIVKRKALGRTSGSLLR